MTEVKNRRWEEVITSTNMTHDSPKAWKTVRKLSNGPTTSSPPCIVSANHVAHQLIAMTEVTCHPHEIFLYYPQQQKDIPPWYTLSAKRVREGSGITKDNKAAGRDDILVEQLKNIGPKPHRWLLAVLNKCFMEIKIPQQPFEKIS